MKVVFIFLFVLFLLIIASLLILWRRKTVDSFSEIYGANMESHTIRMGNMMTYPKNRHAVDVGHWPGATTY
jgi:uncharacterized protein YxeA